MRTRLSSASATVSKRRLAPIAARIAALAALRTSRSAPGNARRHAGSSTTTVQLALGLLVARVIGLDDAGHQVVAHHVLRGEPHEADAVHALQRLDRVGEARALVVRQVGLAGIAGDHHARALADADAHVPDASRRG